ncbi:MAG: hypothetical protein ACKVHL_05875 [Rhodospirillales bacterium]|jgi:hypothetical protein
MKLSQDDIRNMSRAIDLNIPDDDLNTIALRLSAMLSVMEEIEKELGDEMDKIEPIPPVYPHEEF